MLKLKDNLRSSLLDLGADHGFHAEFEWNLKAYLFLLALV